MECASKIVVHCISKSRDHSAQTKRDDNTIANRKRIVGARYSEMERMLEQFIRPKVTREKLFMLAALLRDEGLVEGCPDRLCRRKKEAFICWFCEHERATYSIFERLSNASQQHSQVITPSSELTRVEQSVSREKQIDEMILGNDNDNGNDSDWDFNFTGFLD
jgi:hypothetical protein